MIYKCPHCQQIIKLNTAQQDKVRAALAELPAGKFLKIECPQCRQAIKLTANGSSAGDVGTTPKPPKPVCPPPEKPKPPDLAWLVSGEYEEKEVIEEIPTVLIVMADNPARDIVAGAFMENGYKPVFPESTADAVQQMTFTDYSAVVLHSRYEGDDLKESGLHVYMKGLAMNRRRYIFYVLIGPEFNTLYDLEALACSANLTVNDKDVGRIALILKKSFVSYEKLFGPVIEVLKAHGRR